MSLVLVPLPGNEPLATRLADALRCSVASAQLRAFPDGESLVRLDGIPPGAQVAACCTLDRPDAKIFPLVLAARGARELGARSVGLVAPYLPYLRQDAEFHPGEVVSAQHLGWLLSGCFDWIVTVDPHLHRLVDLGAVFSVPASRVSAAPALASWIRANVGAPVVVGPDAESEQWTSAVAALAGAPWLVASKLRQGDRDVRVTIPESDSLVGRTPVLVDDVISTGATMAAAVRQLVARGLAAPACLATHAVFAGDAERALREAGSSAIVTSDTIPHATNGVGVAPLLAEAVAKHVADER